MSFENIQKFVLTLLYGGLILQSFIVLINPMKVNQRANALFGSFLFLWSSYWILDVLQFCGLSPNQLFVFFIYFIEILTPIFLFFSVVFFINPNYRFSKKDTICLITPIIYLILLLNAEGNKTVGITADFVAIFHNLPYIAIIYIRIKKYQKRIESISSNTENINLEWLAKLSLLLFCTIIITVCYELFNVFIYKLNNHLAMDLLFLFIVYSTSYHILRQKEIYPVNEKERQELLSIELEDELKSEKKKLIADSDFENLKQKLIDYMKTEKPYLDGELNLSKLSGFIGINAHQLSYLLNNGFGENFFQFVNKYRVQRAKELLCDDSYRKLSILGIAFEAGFNSKTAFNTIFKKLTNETPSEFRKNQTDL
ncbi:AraC-type DNA-binding protein [Epilithonimonas zeae]|uniref:AraC-type DNA-binding protein n=2 Tax=Epilithonimonas zeae TaxID=1416779 RepID=A0A1N6E297_9FLAO|nr:AraC-type DNA-binding protein [Epilithonimonas zeae]